MTYYPLQRRTDPAQIGPWHGVIARQIGQQSLQDCAPYTPARGFTGDDIIAHIPALRVFARGLCRNSAQADDLVQDTLLKAIEKASQYHADTNLRAWLFTIMRNRFYSNFVKSRREAPGTADCASASVIPVEGAQLWHMELEELKAALRTLPVHFRETLMLVCVLGESYVRAAEILDCDIGTVKSRVSRARKMLRDRLGKAE